MRRTGPSGSILWKGDQEWSLRAHLAILLALTASFTLTGFALVFLIWEDAETRKHVDAELTAAVDHTTVLIESTLQRQLNALSMVAASPVLASSLERSDVDAMTRVLTAMAQANPDFARLAVLDRRGMLIANSATDKSAIGRDFSQLAYVAAALEKRQAQVGEPRPAISQQFTLPVLPLGAPIIDSSGAVIGVLQSTTELAVISGPWSRLRVGESGFVSVRARAGHVIVHPDVTRLMRQPGDDEAQFSAAGTLFPLQIAANAGRTSNIAHQRVSEGTGWTVRAQMPISDVATPLWTRLIAAGCSAGAFAVVAALVGIRASRRISTSLERLTQAVEDERDDGPASALAPSSVREISALSWAYQQLRERLTERTRQHESAESALRAHADRLRHVTRLNQSIASSLSTNDVLSEIAGATAQLMAARVVMIWVIDGTAGVVRLQATTDQEFSAPGSLTSVPLGESVPGWVALHGQTLQIDDLQSDHRVLLADWWRQHGISSVLAIPLVDSGNVAAVISLMGASPFRLTGSDEDVLAMFLSQASVALHNARLFAAEAAARAQAEATEQQLRALLDAAPDGVLVADEHGSVIVANQMVAEMAGKALSDIIGHPSADLVTSASRPTLRAIIDEAMTSPGAVVQSTGRDIRGVKDGSSDLPIEFSMTAIRTPSGWNRISVIRDISQRMEVDRQKDQLLASEQRARRGAELAAAQVRTLIESAADAILSVDQDGRITLVNARLEALFGYRREELLGQSVEMLMPERARAAHVELRGRFMSGASARPMGPGLDLKARRKDGTEFPVEVSLGPVETPEGLRYFGVVVDVTAQRALTRQKDQFVSIVSHELRTPLTPILGLAGLLLATPLDDRQRRMIETINRSGQNLLAIVNDLLDLSKLQGGHVQLEEIPLSVMSLIEDIVEPVGVKANEKGITLAWEITDDVPNDVVADPVRLRQVLTNLLDNAVKFTSVGTVVLQVDLVESSQSDQLLRFSVADSGIGIAPAAAARIFEPFTQASNSTVREFGGTGLGLAVCKQLVQLMSGQIHVSSEEGRGSTFTFTARVRACGGRPPTATDPPGASRVADLRVMIADSRPVVQRWLRQVLTGWGAVVDVTDRGSMVLSRLRLGADAATPFDVLFLESALPDLPGLDVARAIWRSPTLAHTQTILLAARQTESLLTEADQAGVRAITRFPMSRAELSELLLLATSAPSSPSHALSPPSAEVGTPAAMLGVASDRVQRPADVLIVDDSPINQFVIAALLKSLGYEAHSADSGRAALDKLTMAHSYRAVVMDCQMPDMDGFEATEKLRALEVTRRKARLPVIAMTANAMSDQRDQCLAAGMNDFLTKPIDPVAFAITIRRWAGGPSHEHEAGSAGDVTPPTPAAPEDVDLDHAMLDMLRRLRSPDGSEMFESVVDSYSASAPEHVAALLEQLNAGDLDAALRTAHRLAGESATVGAAGVSRLARRLEVACSDGTLEADLHAQVTRLAASVPLTISALRAHQRKASLASTSAIRP